MLLYRILNTGFSICIWGCLGFEESSFVCPFSAQILFLVEDFEEPLWFRADCVAELGKSQFLLFSEQLVRHSRSWLVSQVALALINRQTLTCQLSCQRLR
jgi:hypothetical protein